MNIEEIEKVEGKVCSKCGVWKPLEEYSKRKTSKDGKRSECKECQSEQNKQWRENNKEKKKEANKQWREKNPKYDKQWRENNKEHKKEYNKQYYQNNKEHKKEYNKQWRENNPKHKKEYDKQWREKNPRYDKQYRENNKERCKELGKRWRENNKQNNLQYISSIVEQINPIFKQSNLLVYGYVYMFENVKTGHKYVGQSINPIKTRYKSGIIQGWIKERLNKSNQKFTEELIEEDIVVTEVLDVAFCQYHLDKLEAYYIDKYDSFLNGYNNREGNHNTDDGIEEFNQILLENNLEFIDGKLVKMA